MEPNALSPFVLPPAGLQTRWATAENPEAAPGAGGQALGGRKGRPCVLGLEPGAVQLLAQAAGPGMVRRLWITLSERTPEMLRGLVLRFYWDGAEQPAVEVPFGDFFCQPLGRTAVLENEWFDSAEGRSFNCRLPMPFRDGFRCTLTNESPHTLRMLFYEVDFTLGDDHGPETGYLHAGWRRENPTVPGRDFEILPRVAGRGRFLGASLGVLADTARYGKTWWGEGEVKIYLDGDTEFPTLCGTGTEDYIGTGWGQGSYSCRWHGSPLADGERFAYGFYRLHGPDPVYFHREIRVAIQQIGYAEPARLADAMEAGGPQSVQAINGETFTAAQLRRSEREGILFERQDDWCATTYYYLDRPAAERPPLPPYAERVRGLDADERALQRLDGQPL